MNKFSSYLAKKVKRQSGFTMIEILVGLVLGVSILTAALSMQSQYKRGFKLSGNKLDMQTNAKFAFEYIGKSLRSAGSLGCKSALGHLEYKSEEVKISSGGCYSNVCIDFNDTLTSFADFRPGWEIKGYEYTGAGATLPVLPVDFTFVSSGYNNNDSDVLSVSGGFGEVYNVSPEQDLVATDTGFTLDMTGPVNIRLKQFQYGMLTSCKGAKVFKVTSSDGAIAAGNIQWGAGGAPDDNAVGLLGEKGWNVVGSGNEREFRRAAVTTYFVGMDPLGDVNGVPTLYQDVDGVSSRLIEGVEEIHILYGLSDDPRMRNVADRYVTADVIDAETTPLVNKWARIVSVRIGIITRSIDPVFKSPQTQTKSLACVGYTQASKTDKFARATYCTEISVRNRLLGTRIGDKV